MEIGLTILLAAGLLFLSAAFSGLNIGLLMVRPDELRRKRDHGDEVAERVYRYRKNGNYLIVCVLLGNVMVISILTLVFDSLAKHWLSGLAAAIAAGVGTTLLVTAFGEILPQSLFSQRGWRLSRHFFWLLDIIFVLFWPIAWPVSKLLDTLIGRELPALYSREELEHLVREHAEHAASSIDHDESRIVSGALRFSKQTVADIAMPAAQAFTLSIDDQLDASLISRIKRSGHSRLPVKNQQGSYVGMLLVKDLIGRPIGEPVSRVYRDMLHDIHSSLSLDTALSRFIQTHSHMFKVLGDENEVIGFVTLEDIIEVIIRRDIEDEFDS